MSEKTITPKSVAPSYWKRTTAVGLVITLLTWSHGFQTSSLPHEYALCSNSNSIYTMDEKKPQVDCILVSGSHIKDTGSLAEMKERRRSLCLQDGLSCLSRRFPWVSEWKEIHLNPNFLVVPGLADAHSHILAHGFKINLPLGNAGSVQEVMQQLKEYVLRHPDIRKDNKRWIEGIGWDQSKWDMKDLPSAADFEEEPLLKGRYILLESPDGRVAWVSNRVIELIGNLPDEVEGGTIVRDEQGHPTGIFLDKATSLIQRPPRDERAFSQYYEAAMRDALKHGLTSIHDAGSVPEHIEFLKKRAENETLPIRMYLIGMIDSDGYRSDRIPQLIDYGEGGRLNVRSIKLVMDRGLRSYGAALLEPYSDKPSTNGTMHLSEEKLRELVTQLWKEGWQVNVHCRGDRANQVALDVFEHILTHGGNASTWRPRIEHAQILQPSDFERIGRLSVIPSVQPTHATDDMWFAESRLGPERIRGAYAYQTLLQSSPKRILPLGLDFPVGNINPLVVFYAAISRLSPDGESPHGPGGWYPEERLLRAQALKGMTLDAAYASFAENEIGSLERGKKADFVVFDRNIMAIAVQDILSTRVIATIVDGRLMYGGL